MPEPDTAPPASTHRPRRRTVPVGVVVLSACDGLAVTTAIAVGHPPAHGWGAPTAAFLIVAGIALFAFRLGRSDTWLLLAVGGPLIVLFTPVWLAILTWTLTSHSALAAGPLPTVLTAFAGATPLANYTRALLISFRETYQPAST